MRLWRISIYQSHPTHTLEETSDLPMNEDKSSLVGPTPQQEEYDVEIRSAPAWETCQHLSLSLSLSYSTVFILLLKTLTLRPLGEAEISGQGIASGSDLLCYLERVRWLCGWSAHDTPSTSDQPESVKSHMGPRQIMDRSLQRLASLPIYGNLPT